MALHLIKLCVGAESVDDLKAWIDRRIAEKRAAGLDAAHVHVTRMVPRRADEIVGGGSLYWVIRGFVQARQRLVAVQPFTDGEGIGRCRLVLDPVLVATDWQPRRPFQGWRYFDPKDAPHDLVEGGGAGELPSAMRRELAELGLL